MSALDLLADVPEATGPTVRAARLAAGLTLDQAAQIMGLSGRQALSKIESGAGTDRVRLALLLLATDQHPKWRAEPQDDHQATPISPAPGKWRYGPI